LAIVGIDLGTTNSCISIIEQNEPVVIPNEEGSRTSPSVVAFTEDNSRIAGAVAKRQALVNPLNTVFAVKRLIGRKIDSGEVKKSIEISPFTIVSNTNGDAWVEVNGNRYSPQEISSNILTKMKIIAEEYLGYEVNEAVITVPAHFNDIQRQATKDSGKIAGLEVKRIINEPTAAALAYGMENKVNQKIAVFDLGGGTFDFTILEIANGVFDVKATSGDTYLGGDDFDQRIIEHVVEVFKTENNIDLKEDKMALQRIREACEKAKHELSSIEETNINLPFIAVDSTGPKHLNLKLTRAELEKLVDDLITRLAYPCQQAMNDAGMDSDEIDEIVLVGGMTRMPKVREKVKQIFGKEAQTRINPEEVVAIGAAIQGGVLEGKVEDVLLLDVVPLSLGIETKGELFTKIIERNTTIPTMKSQVFTTAYDNQDFVSIHVLQGEREMVNDNISLAKFNMVDIPLAPKGVPQIEVSYEVDTDGILHVSAHDLGTDNIQKIVVENSSGLNDEEIDSIINQSQKNKEVDKSKKEYALLKNEAEGLIYSVKKTLSSHGEKIDSETDSRIRSELEVLENELNSEDYNSLNIAFKSLQDISYKFAQMIYSTKGSNINTEKPATETLSSIDSDEEKNVTE
jgi:molecular chaperone DnaK